MRSLLFSLIMTTFAGLLFGQGSAFLSGPAISPDGAKIAFTYESDIWMVDRNGGTAHRLTAMAGDETLPKFSPDGKWIAFASNQNGNADIYVMPSEGGRIVQLTYHDAYDYPAGWSWDSKTIYFTSDRYNTFAAYSVPVTGGTAVRLFSDNFFDQAHNVAEIPGTKAQAFYFSTSWESYTSPQRKRYKGDNNPDIEYYNKANREYKRITTWEGKDLWPTVDRNGKLWFASDEGNSEYNLYTIENGEKRQITSFPTSILRPQVSADGKFVVFARDYQIWTYDTQSGKSTQCDIKVWSNENLETDITYSTAEKISDFDVSQDGKKIAFVSRGRLFVSDITGKFIKEMPTESKERVAEVRWLKDNETLLYTRTVKGFANLFTISASAPEAEKQITNNESTITNIIFNPDNDKAIYQKGTGNIDLMDLKTFESKNIIKGEFWNRASQPRFSPDGRYIVYASRRNFEQDIFIFDTKDGKTYELTNNGVPEDAPFWSPDGKYIYLSSSRTSVGYPRGGGMSKIYRIPLYRFTETKRTDEYSKLFSKSKEKDSLKIDIRIETEGINQRWQTVDIKGLGQSSPQVYNIKDKTILLCNNATGNGWSRELTKVELSPFDSPKTSSIGNKGFSRLIQVNNKFFALMSGDVYEIKIEMGKADIITLSTNFSKNLNDEFVQMFYENWATLDELFYDAKHHGVDWKAMRTRYEKYLPLIRNRDNLRTIQNDMLGELNSSHLGFNSWGDEAKAFYKLQTNATGILWSDKDPFVVAGWVKRSPVDLTDSPLMIGDKLVAVNGTPVGKETNRNKLFALPRLLDELTLRFERKGKVFDFTINPISSVAFRNLLYDNWIDENRAMVDKQTNNRVGYAFMKDMGVGSLDQFLLDMTSINMNKEALILDIRNNRGGNVHDDVLKFLSQTPYLEWQARDGSRAGQPNFAPSRGPIILLINEQSLSDAEMTAAGFKQLGLGTIIGTETYRWIIFTSAKQMVDGSSTRLPQVGCFDLDGNDLEITGVKPDIYVRTTFEDMQKGVDPQMDMAIKEVMRQLNAKN